MKPNIENQLRGEAVTQALQTIERRVNELGVAEPIVARQGAVDQILVRAARRERRAARQGHHPLHGAARAEDRRAGAVRRAKSGAGRPTATPCRPTCCCCRGPATPRRRRPPGTVFYVVRRAPVVTGRDLRNARPSLDENNLPAVGFSLNQDGARKFGTATEAEHRPPARHRARRPRVVGAGHPEPHHGRGPHHRHVHAAGGAGPVARAAVRRAAGVADLPRRAHRRPDARRRFDPRRRARRRSAASRWSCSSCSSTTSSPGSTRSSRSS